MTRFVLCVAAVLAASGAARAGGLFVPGYGPQAQPRAGAFVAKADDASALYYNPAGLAWQKGTSLALGMNFVDFEQSFKRAGSYETPETGDPVPWTGQEYEEVKNDSTPAVGFGGFQGIPLIGLVTDLGGRTPLVFGVGMIADHGYPERKYQADYQPDDPDTPPPPQRYDIIEQDVSAAFPSLAAAYAITQQLAVGLRLSWGFGGSKGTQFLWALRNYPEDARTDGRFQADLFDPFIPAAALGVHYRVSPSFELGANYNTVKHVHFKGDGQAILGSNVGLGEMRDFIAPETDFPLCEGGGDIAHLKTCVNLDLPQNATLGGRYIVRDGAGRERGDVEFDVQWEDWSSSSDVEVIVDGKSGLTGLRLNPVLIRHGFKDTYSFRLGGAWGFDLGDNRLITRAGAAYDTAAAPLSWTRLDVDGMARTTLGAGLGYEMGAWRFDLGGGVVLESKRTVTPECNPDLDNLGCPTATGEETPQDERERPDPIQPLTDPNAQVESPFNAGTYEQSYVLLSLGVTYMF